MYVIWVLLYEFGSDEPVPSLDRWSGLQGGLGLENNGGGVP